MHDAYVHAARTTRFGRGAPSLEALAVDAAAPLLREHEVDAVVVGNQGAELFGDGANLAGRVADALGLTGAPATRVENATASGSAAFAAAVDMVRGGRFRSVLVVGVERMTHVETHNALRVLSGMLAPDERAAGASPAALAALMARAYLHEHAKRGVTRERLADVTVWMHENGLRNVDAQFQKRVTREDVLASPEVAAPLRVMDCAPMTDGAAALLVSSAPGPVRVAAVAHATDAQALTRRTDPRRLTSFRASRLAARQAFDSAKWTPERVDVMELHDAFTVLLPIAAEDVGFAPAGEGLEWLEANRARVNPGGGLKARGHPAGATGTAQLAELFLQLTGAAAARARQVEGCRRALAHNVGGVGTSAIVTLLEVSA